MITIFEGPRNSGKTFLTREYSRVKNTPIFKFDFVGWFDRLNLSDTARETHTFALGKELMLLQLNSQGFLPDFVLDRGILTVLTWGIISDRISKESALHQITMISEQGLLDNIEFVIVSGKNPSGESRNKDRWDFREDNDEEMEILSLLLEEISKPKYNIRIRRILNTFDEKTLIEIGNL